MDMTTTVLRLAQEAASSRPAFFEKKGPGVGDRDTNEYMADLRSAVQKATGVDCSEQRICGESNLAVDFYLENEETIVEIALSLRNPNCEFERDILKALMAQDEGYRVARLVFVSKPGGVRRLAQPSSRAIITWVRRNHDLRIEVEDLKDE